MGLSRIKPWLTHYDPGVPHDITLPPIVLPELLETAAHQFPDAAAILFFGKAITYAELDMLASRFAAARFTSASTHDGSRSRTRSQSATAPAGA